MRSSYTDKTEQDVVVPESPLIRPVRKDKYGMVPGLDDDERMSPEEAERLVYLHEFRTLWDLPVVTKSNIKSVVEDGHVHWGAFSSMDFDRYQPELDKARYKADILREKLKDRRILFDIAKDQVPGRAKWLILKYLRMGVLNREHIQDIDLLHLAGLQRQILNLRREITELEEAAEKRRRRLCQKILGE
jgi:hypothetical protein